MKLLHRQRWLCVWGLLALALQLAWAAGHVHPHVHPNLESAAAGNLIDLHHDADSGGAASEQQPTGPAPGEHHDAHPDCATCWTQSLAAALALPDLPVLPLRRALRHVTAARPSSALPASSISHGFQARAPPHRLSALLAS